MFFDWCKKTKKFIDLISYLWYNHKYSFFNLINLGVNVALDLNKFKKVNLVHKTIVTKTVQQELLKSCKNTLQSIKKFEDKNIVKKDKKI